MRQTFNILIVVKSILQCTLMCKSLAADLIFVRRIRTMIVSYC